MTWLLLHLLHLHVWNVGRDNCDLATSVFIFFLSFLLIKLDNKYAEYLLSSMFFGRVYNNFNKEYYGELIELLSLPGSGRGGQLLKC